MQARSGRGHGTFFAGEDRLIAFVVGVFLLPFHVGREGEVAMAGGVDFLIPLNKPVSFFVDFDDGADALSNLDRAADLHALARADEAFPVEGVAIVEAEKLGPAVIGKEASGDHAGVIEDEVVPELDILRKLGKFAMGDCSAGTINDQHAGGRAVLEGIACNEFIGELEVEVTGAHDQ